jgi:hypothetical protein
LFDYRTNYGWDYYGWSRAIIEKSGDYRPINRAVSNETRHHRRMTRSHLVAKARGSRRRLPVDPLNELERQRSARRLRQRAQSERIFHAQYLLDPNTVAPHPIRFLAVCRDAKYEVFIVIAFRLDRRNAVPVEEFGRGEDVLRVWLRH